MSVVLTDQENAWIMRVWGAAPGRDRLAAEKSRLEDIIERRVKAERDRIAAELNDYEVQRALTNAMEDHVRGHASSNSPHSFYCDGACATQAAMFRLGIILRERAARIAPLQDAEEVGE